MLYEYKCGYCGYIFEQTLSVKDSDVPKSEPCPDCSTVGYVDRYYSVPPTFNYSCDGSYYKGDTGFQKHVLGRINASVPENLRKPTKFKIPSEF
jgi:rubredoxin